MSAANSERDGSDTVMLHIRRAIKAYRRMNRSEDCGDDAARAEEIYATFYLLLDHGEPLPREPRPATFIVGLPKGLRSRR